MSELLGGYGDSTIKLWERHFPSSGYTWISNKKISAVFGKSHWDKVSQQQELLLSTVMPEGFKRYPITA